MCSDISVRVQYSFRYELRDENWEIKKDEDGCTIWRNDEEKFEQSLPTFQKFLQEFYNDAIDNSLFTNAKTEVKLIQEKFIQKEKEKERKEERARMAEDKLADILFMPINSPRKFGAIVFAIFFIFAFVQC